MMRYTGTLTWLEEMGYRQPCSQYWEKRFKKSYVFVLAGTQEVVYSGPDSQKLLDELHKHLR